MLPRLVSTAQPARMRSSNAGFTLLELLIALLIFAILSSITVLGLRSVVNVYARVSQQQVVLRRVSLLATLMRQDVSQIVPLPSKNNGRYLIASLHSVKDGFFFTRTGWMNPFDLFRRSDLMRVGYVLRRQQLLRLIQPIYMEAGTTTAEQVLLSNVLSFSVRYVDQQGRDVLSWPPPPTSTQSQQPSDRNRMLPILVDVTVIARPNQHLHWLLPVVSGRYYEK